MLLSVFLLVALRIGQIHVFAEPVVTVNESIVTTTEGAVVNVTCIASNTTFQSNPVINWYDESDMPLPNVSNSKEYQMFLGYDNSSLNTTFRVQLIVNIPDMASDFEMKYTCKLTNESLNTFNTTQRLTVQIYVPLTIVSSTPPLTLCINDAAALACLFRSNPLPDPVSWNKTDDDGVLIRKAQNNSYSETELAVLQVETTTSYTCEATSQDFDGNVVYKSEAITVNVRDDQLQQVTHKTVNFTSCYIEWNETTVMDVTGYQVKIVNGSKPLVVYVNDPFATNYTWEMKEGDVLTIEVAMIMNECTGLFTPSNGNCTYIKIKPTVAPPPGPDVALIVVATVLSVIIVVLLVVFGVLFYKSRRNQTTYKKKELPTRRSTEGNKYSRSPERKRSNNFVMTNTAPQFAQGHMNAAAEPENVYDDTIDNNQENTYDDVVVPPDHGRNDRNIRMHPPPRTTSLEQSDDQYEVPNDYRPQGMPSGGDGYRGQGRGYRHY